MAVTTNILFMVGYSTVPLGPTAVVCPSCSAVQCRCGTDRRRQAYVCSVLTTFGGVYLLTSNRRDEDSAEVKASKAGKTQPKLFKRTAASCSAASSISLARTHVHVRRLWTTLRLGHITPSVLVAAHRRSRRSRCVFACCRAAGCCHTSSSRVCTAASQHENAKYEGLLLGGIGGLGVGTFP